MIKKILQINLIFIFVANLVFAEVVKTISIKGNERISKQTILVYGDFKIDDDLSDNDLNEILKNLYSTNFFNDIKISLINNSLEIKVVENPIVQSIFVEGIKKKNIKKLIFDLLDLKEKSSYVKYLVEKDKDKILNTLKVSGYYFAEIQTLLNNNDNNTVDITYKIELGKKASIKKILFTGNKIFKDRKLKNIITTEESKPWKLLSGKKFLDKKRIMLDERLLNNFYKNKGYYNSKIFTSSAELLDAGDFELTYNINAGKKFFYNNLQLVLPVDYNPDHFDGIIKTLNELKTQPYTLKSIENILDELDKVALSKQYEFISADIEENIVDNNKLDFNIIIKETEKFYVERIDITGNTITKEEVIRDQLLVDEGDAFNEILHNKTLNKLNSLRIFKKVDSQIVKGSSDEQKIINISIEEKATGEISAGAGVGTNGASLGFSIIENNYMGSATQLSTHINISAETLRGALSLNIPNYNYTDRSLYLSAESSAVDLLKKSGYKSTKIGFAGGTAFQQYENFYFSPRLSFYVEDLHTDSTASTNLKKQDGQYFESMFNYNLNYDLRNQTYQPSDGFKSVFSQTLPLISDTFAITNGYTFSSYHEMAEEMIASFSIYTKFIRSLADNKDVRISDRLQIPSNRLRGFEKGRVGPTDNGDFIGGNNNVSLNLSTNLPMMLPSAQNLDFKIFFDAANVWGVDYANDINDSSKIRSAIGLGVDWFTPIGPLNFSLAQPITKKDTDIVETFRFNLGTTF